MNRAIGLVLVPAGYLIAEDVKAAARGLWRPSAEPHAEPPLRKPA